MIIKSVELKNFRNYDSLSMEFDAGTNILYGDNAQGKTNVLEAVYVSGTTKSHRASKDREMLQFGYEEAHIRTLVEKHDFEYRIDMHLKKNQAKGIAINGMPIKRSGELLGILNIIFFSPEDLDIIKRGPSERRRFLDLELCQLDKIYLSNLTKYNKALNQRNKLLKDIDFRPDLLDTLPVWDMQVCMYGREVMARRRSFLEELSQIAETVHGKLSGGKETLHLQNEPDCEEEEFEKKLTDNFEKDKKNRTTTSGPHRDDINFVVNGIDIRKYGSQGQQRTSALSLKLAEIELVKRRIHDTPVLLLDDVLSELDSNRQKHLLDSIQDTQTIITCTGLDDFVANQFNIHRVFRIKEGQIVTQP